MASDSTLVEHDIEPTLEQLQDFERQVAGIEIKRQLREVLAPGVAFRGCWLCRPDLNVSTDLPDTLTFSCDPGSMWRLEQLLATAQSGKFPASLAFDAGTRSLVRIAANEGVALVSLSGLRELLGVLRLHVLVTHDASLVHRENVAHSPVPATVDVVDWGWPDRDPLARPELSSQERSAAMSQETAGDVFPANPYVGQYYYHRLLREPFWYAGQHWLGTTQPFGFGQSASVKSRSYLEMDADNPMTSTRGLILDYPVMIDRFEVTWRGSRTGVIALVSGGGSLISRSFDEVKGVAFEPGVVAPSGKAITVRMLELSDAVRYTVGHIEYRRVGIQPDVGE